MKAALKTGRLLIIDVISFNKSFCTITKHKVLISCTKLQFQSVIIFMFRQSNLRPFKRITAQITLSIKKTVHQIRSDAQFIIYNKNAHIMVFPLFIRRSKAFGQKIRLA